MQRLASRFLVSLSMASVVLGLAMMAPVHAGPTTPQPPTRKSNPVSPKVGSPNPASSVLTVMVNKSGVITRGAGAVSSANLDTGKYEVIFNRNIRTCTFVSTQDYTDNQGQPPAGMMSLVGRFNNPNGVFVQTFDAAGKVANRAFSLTVACP